MTTPAHTPETPAREEWLTLQEACALIGVSPATLRRWSANGDIRTFTTPGGHRRFARSAILGLLAATRDVSGTAPSTLSGAASAARSGAASAAQSGSAPSSSLSGSAPASSSLSGAAGGSGAPPLPPLLALVARARQVPSAAREAFARELFALQRSEATIVVHTCHRVELYVALEAFGERPLPQPPPGSRRLEGVEAARHLVSVACGLDSAVLCENQLLHQLRDTLSRRHASHALDPVLDRLFQVALQAGRRARSRFGNPQRSLADVALERIEEQAGACAGRRMLVVGAGVMGRLAAFAAARQRAEVIVTSRTAERAAALAREVGGRAVAFEGEQLLPPQIAGAIVALGGRWPVAGQDVQALSESGTIVVDMSSPVAVPDALRAALGERFIGADDLASQGGGDPQDALRDQLERLVAQSTDSYCRWLRARNAVPVIQTIGEAADERRRDELEWLFRRLPGLGDGERSLIEQMSNRLVADILHAPRSALGVDGDGRLAQAARELFGA